MLYVEGPRDREVLSTWSRRIDPPLTRVIDRSTTILGGRQPTRALEDFQKRGGTRAGVKGLVVLDRDDRDDAEAESEIVALRSEGLECFVWGHRHIESYLLVPSVIRRLIGSDPEDRRIEEVVAAAMQPTPREVVPAQSLHAKRILGPGGSLSVALGVSLRAGQIARAMRYEELHEDVHELFRCISRMAGLTAGAPSVVVRQRRPTEP